MPAMVRLQTGNADGHFADIPQHILRFGQVVGLQIALAVEFGFRQQQFAFGGLVVGGCRG